MRAVVSVRQLMRRRMRRKPVAAADRRSTMSTRVAGDRCRSRITVVNIRQEAFYRCDEHAKQRNERAGTAEQKSKRRSPTRHERDT